MEDQNVIIFCDKVKKLIDYGNHPKAVSEIDTLIVELEHKMRKKNGKVILPLPVPEPSQISDEAKFSLDTRKKQNEIIEFINRRFST